MFFPVIVFLFYTTSGNYAKTLGTDIYQRLSSSACLRNKTFSFSSTVKQIIYNFRFFSCLNLNTVFYYLRHTATNNTLNLKSLIQDVLQTKVYTKVIIRPV